MFALNEMISLLQHTKKAHTEYDLTCNDVGEWAKDKILPGIQISYIKRALTKRRIQSAAYMSTYPFMQGIKLNMKMIHVRLWGAKKLFVYKVHNSVGL